MGPGPGPPLLDPVTIDTVLEIEVECNFIPSSPLYRSKIPNPHQREYLIIQSLTELSSSSPDHHHLSLSLPSPSCGSSSSQPSSEKDDTVKELATLLLTIFHQCDALPLLQSLQVSLTSSVPPPPLSSASLSSSSSSPYAILISICDPSLSQCETRYGKMISSSPCSSVSPSLLLPLVEENTVRPLGPTTARGGVDDDDEM